jgi:hypothetical protein
VRTEDPNDVLSVSHHHADGGPPSFKDIRRCFEDNNVGYANVHGPKDIFIMESKGKFVSERTCEHLKSIYWECIGEAYLTYKSKRKPFNDVAKENIINNEELDNYITFYWCDK